MKSLSRYIIALLMLAALWIDASRVSAQSPCGCMDVALVIDDSGSMGGVINNIKAELPNIISSAETASGGDVRFGLVTFPNLGGALTNDGIFVRQAFTTDTALIDSAIQALNANGGFGEPESSDAALEYVITGSAPSGCIVTNPPLGSFRPQCVKIAVMITDAHPGGCDDTFTVGTDDVHAHAVAVEAAQAGVLISAIYVPSFGEIAEIRDIMEDYADTSNGTFVETEQDGSGAGEGIADIIATCGGVAQGCITRNARFWFTHALPAATNCVSLLGALESNGGGVRLGFIRLPTTYRNADNELNAEDALIEALGLYWRSPGVTGEESGTQSDRTRGSRLCRARKKLAAELIAATANFRMLGTVPDRCSYKDGNTVTNFPADLLARAREAARGPDPEACNTMRTLLKKFNQSGMTNNFTGRFVECSPDQVRTLRRVSRDPTTILNCPGINDTCDTAETLFDFPFTRNVDLSAYTDSFGNPSCGAGGADAFWSVAPPIAAAGRNFVIDTKDSNFSPLISVWTGANCSNLTEVACGLGATAGSPTNLLQFTASGTNTYYIVIEGIDGATGNLKMRIKSF